MIKKLINAIRDSMVGMALVAGSLGAVALVPVQVGATPPPAAPTSPTDSICQGVKGATGQSSCDGTQFPAFIKTVINVMLFLIGLIAVIMIVVGGIRYVVSGGDQSAVTGAKNTIMYAVVGLVVALLGFAIVNFVVGAFTPPAKK